jgi:transposase
MAAKRDHKEMEKRRLRGCKMLEKGYGCAEVAQRLGVTRAVVYRWQAAWQCGGRAAVVSKGRAGRKAKLDAQAAAKITEALLAGPRAQGYKTDLWTLPRVGHLIEKLAAVRYHEGHVWRVLGKLGFSCQRPERRAVERDDQQVRHWRRKAWPALKKTPGGKSASSSLSMRAD